MSSIDSAATNDPKLLAMLRGHSGVLLAEEGDSPLRFQQGEQTRTISIGDVHAPVYGLVELIDNNPLVCADAVSLPSAGAAMSLLCLGPILAAGIAVQPPLVHLNQSAPRAEIEAALAAIGGNQRTRFLTAGDDPSVAQLVNNAVFGKEQSSEGLWAAQAAVVVQKGLTRKDLEGLFDERFGRSFYIRRKALGSHFRTSDLIGLPYAQYSVEVETGFSFSTVLIEAAADGDGKLGAAGILHAMNVMTGFEESLGIPT